MITIAMQSSAAMQESFTGGQGNCFFPAKIVEEEKEEEEEKKVEKERRRTTSVLQCSLL